MGRAINLVVFLSIKYAKAGLEISTNNGVLAREYAYSTRSVRPEPTVCASSSRVA